MVLSCKMCFFVIFFLNRNKVSSRFDVWIQIFLKPPLAFTSSPLTILYTSNSEGLDTNMHSNISHCRWLTPGSHIPPLHHCSIVISLCEGIRICVTELLSDIRAVQMDDPSTLAWPTDKKPSLFVRPFPLLLLFLSLIRLWKHSCSHLLHHPEKNVYFPGFPAGPHPMEFFGPSWRNRKPCGVVILAQSHSCAVSLYSSIISSQRKAETVSWAQKWHDAAVNYALPTWVISYLVRVLQVYRIETCCNVHTPIQ